MSKEKSDHALALIKASLNLVPLVGGAIASLVDDYVPTATQRSLERALEYLRQHLDDLGDRIDPEGVNKDEFAELFKSCYLTIVRTHQESKLRAAAALIANILLRDGDPDKLSYTELDHYARCLEALSIGAIETLGHAYERTKDAPRQDFNFEDLRRFGPGIDPELLMGLVGELNAFNLVHLPGAPTIKTADYGNYLIIMTSLGQRFITHLLQRPTR